MCVCVYICTLGEDQNNIVKRLKPSNQKQKLTKSKPRQNKPNANKRHLNGLVLSRARGVFPPLTNLVRVYF